MKYEAFDPRLITLGKEFKIYEVKSWRQAFVDEVDGEALTLSFKFGEEITKNRYSREIAPFESKTKLDYEWRTKQLADASQQSTNVDVLFPATGWEASTVKTLRVMPNKDTFAECESHSAGSKETLPVLSLQI